MSTPTGCSFMSSYKVLCIYFTWNPPLLDNQFSPSPGNVIVTGIDGTLPSNALSGLTNNGGYTGSSELGLDCYFSTTEKLTLLSDSLSGNLAWIDSMSIGGCFDMEIASGAFSALTGLTLLNIMDGDIMNISSSALSGMTSLTTLYFYAGFPASGIPSGMLDGLTALATIDMSRTVLNSIPMGLFDDLTQLTSLQLLDCGLTTLPSNLFTPLLSLTSLDISENNWVCDCDLQWLGTYLTSSGLSSDNCSSPANLTGLDMSQSLLTLTCTSTSTTTNDDGDGDDVNDKWYRYGLIAGASFALLLAIFAFSGCLYQRMKLEELKKSMTPLQRDKLGKSTVMTDIKSNQNVKNGNVLPTEDRYVNKTQARDVLNEDVGMHGSPFDKRSRQVVPTRHHVQRGWASKRDPDEW